MLKRGHTLSRAWPFRRCFWSVLHAPCHCDSGSFIALLIVVVWTFYQECFDLFVEVTPEKILNKEGGGGRSLISYKERNDRGKEKEKKKKNFTRQKIRETIQFNPEREREQNKEGYRRGLKTSA